MFILFTFEKYSCFILYIHTLNCHLYVQTMTQNWAVWKIESGNVTVFEHLHIPYSNIRILEHSRNDSSQFTLEWAISLLLPVDRSLPTDSEHSLFWVIFWLLSQKFSDRIFDRWTLPRQEGAWQPTEKGETAWHWESVVWKKCVLIQLLLIWTVYHSQILPWRFIQLNVKLELFNTELHNVGKHIIYVLINLIYFLKSKCKNMLSAF
jgi:hypothetical protein